VLTAAHCLYIDGTNKIHDVKDIVFRAGLREGKAAATRRVKEASAHAGFDPMGNMSIENVRNDVALLRLAEPISSFEIPSFKIHHEATRPGPVSVVSYGRGRSETQSRQKQCQLIDMARDLMFFDCDSVPGTSGAPVFSHVNGRAQILAVVSGRVTYDGQRRTVGMRLPERVNEVKRQMRMQVRGPVANVRRMGVGVRSKSGGARFVRADGS
jgi:protease YdgD